MDVSADTVRAALLRREALRARADLDCYRLINGAADGVPGVTVDRFGEVAVVSSYQDLGAEEEARLLDALGAAEVGRSLYLKRRPREARVAASTRKDEVAPEQPARGPPAAELDAVENGLLFRIRPAQGLSVGLYLDMRDTRAWVRARAQGRTVLNLFAYTCGFGVCAVEGGAARAVNVDLSRRVLDWGEENARLNGQRPERRDHLSGDAFEWLARLGRKGEAFDLVILDPPSFATFRGGRFSAERDYPRLVEAAGAVVKPKGTLLACCNLAALTEPKFEQFVTAGLHAAGRAPGARERLGASELDFPRLPGEPPALKILATTVRY